MVRYFSSLCTVMVLIGLPLQAKDSNKVATTSSTSSSAKSHSDKPAVAKDKTASSTTTSTKSSKSACSPSPRTAQTNSKGATNLSGKISAAADKIEGRLARLTAYWAGEGDYYTGRCLSSTGIRLHGGHCAVDPRIIPYGSVVEIAGLGTYLAVDTGSAVISREAARETGHTAAERGALVIDLFFESRRDGQRFAANGPKYASISWRAPKTADNATKESRGLIAEENWSKTHNKDL